MKSSIIFGILKGIMLIALLVFLYFIEALMFLLVFGSGANAGRISESTGGAIIFYIAPVVIVAYIGFKIFKK